MTLTGVVLLAALAVPVGAQPGSADAPQPSLGAELQQALADRHLFRVANVCDLLLLDLAAETPTVLREHRMPMAMVCTMARKPAFDWENALWLLERAGIERRRASKMPMAPAVPARSW